MRRRIKQAISSLLAAALLGPALWLTPVAQAETDPTETVTVYHEAFAGGQGAATPSGGASLTAVTGKAFDGNADGAALYVSNRVNNWDAVDFRFADLGLQNGKTYTVTLTGYVDAGVTVPAGAQTWLQTVNGYGWLAGADFAAGSAFTMTKEFTVDTSKDSALRVQSNDAGAGVPFYIGDILITEKTASGGGGSNDRPPALPFNTITFEDQTAGGFAGRAGTETLTVTNEANHTAGGSYSLKVENRTAAWHGPSLRIEKYVDLGFEYTLSVWVKLLSPDSSQLQLSTQIGDGSSASYNNVLGKTITTADGWVLYQGTYRYNNAGGEYLTLYVESSNNGTASYYIDDVSLVRGSGPIGIQKDLIPIKDAYQNDFLIGNAVSSADLDGVRLELLKMHHNAVTAENTMKPDSLQPTKGDFTFDGADAIVDKARAEGLNVHGHVLVWHQQTPAWMNTAQDAQNNTVPLGRDEALGNMRTHIRTVMEHFGSKVISWDVVNEAMNDNPANPSDWQSALRRSPWYQAVGPDYVEQAFLAAREVLNDHPDWDIKLYYNDYNDDNQNKAQAIYSMVKALNDKYAETHPGKKLIDGIGMQGHYNINTNPDNVKLSLEKFISLGVEVSVSELDVQAGSNGQLTEKQAVAQGYLYAQLFKLYKAHADHIARVTFWGLNDATSWRAESSPLPFDKNLQAKPAYYGILDPDKFIAEHPPESTQANQATAGFATPVVDGTVDAVWSRTPEMPINRYQTAWQGAAGTAKALWDNQNLYVLIQVSDAQLDKGSLNPWEQDSVEIFVDQNNAKTSFYQDDDGQYRVNFDNETSFNPPALADGFVSATHVNGMNYTVEVKIPLKSVTPANGLKLGFDVQINDAKDGARQSVAAWNDTTGTGYMDTSVYGELTLKAPPAAPTDLTLTAASSTSIALDWSYASGAPVTFSVFRATAADGPFTEAAANLNDSAFTDTNLQPDTKYYYYVKASDGTTVSQPSLTVSGRTLLAPVGHLAAAALNHQVIRLDWDRIQPAAAYAVYRSTAADGPYTKIADRLSASQYVDNQLEPSTIYYYKVVAIAGNNRSEAASAQAATPAKPGKPQR
ncbi:endo-1,4-beta-xylanase [Cohnella candidum]|uniref:Beta-xylanase n=1 Tax=Cohnella candidum TaxID=2674991 RepID=A0A3G3K1B8_9BACL|nr:endo-1,4-beta-xylanase [Cohnella candidum]AYQ73951.1 glycoside hydrolase [Cohnella candidum]